MKIDMNRLKNYLSDLDPDTSIVDEAIATIEAVAENKTDDELYERERPLMIAYLALCIIKAGLNVSPQNDEIHAHWIYFYNGCYYIGVCSNCGKQTAFAETNDGVPHGYPHCPYCTAKMDEREEDEP